MTIANHDPKTLSDHVADKLVEGGYADYIRKHPIATLDQPSPAVLTQWAKGAPNGLVNPQGKERNVVDTENHVTYPLTQAQYEHSRKHLIGYNDSYEKPARIVRAKAENVLDVSERKEAVAIRNYDVTPQLPPNGLTVAELFCGGGLMAVGLKSAGYTLTFANDFDKRAVQAYAHNIGDHVVCGDITSDEIQAQIPDADIIAGGPPCQDYSVAGSGAGEEGERGKLVWTYLSIIERKQPKAFVFENVKGIITKRHRPTFDALLQRFDEIGYTVTWRLINSWDFGVAQKRERVFIVGIRKDLGFTFKFPEPRAEDYRTQVLRDVIGDLPEPSANHEKKLITEKAMQGYARRNAGGAFGFRVNKWEEPSPTIMGRIFNEGKAFVHPSYADNHDGHPFDNVNPDWTYEKANRQATWDKPGATVGGHARNEGIHPGSVSNHGEQMKLATDAEIIPTLPQGCTGREAAKPHPDIFWSNYAREAEDSAGRTVTGEGKPKIHPTQPRRITVRECLRIQSVPDWYVLPDDISLSAQYRIVGNGVASRVAYVIGTALAEQLNAVLTQGSALEAA
ncbi:DNA cytosine methyltransferase [Paenibacillus sp. NRS-1782]|uniref:DNA cytosine methyltransferase n=1 Tax=unclassified Paenibacillus TaxID=185978 RepID=UPI003D2E263C